MKDKEFPGGKMPMGRGVVEKVAETPIATGATKPMTGELDEFTSQHLKSWLSEHVVLEDQVGTELGIRRLLSEHPTLLDDHSWPELQALAERGDFLKKAVQESEDYVSMNRRLWAEREAAQANKTTDPPQVVKPKEYFISVQTPEGEKFISIPSKPVKVQSAEVGDDLFIHRPWTREGKPDTTGWVISEGSTGKAFTNTAATQADAIERAKTTMQKYRDRFNQSRKQWQERAPLSPRYGTTEGPGAAAEYPDLARVAKPVVLPQELQGLAEKASGMSKDEFLGTYNQGLAEQNLTRRETAQKIDAFMKRNLKVTPEQFYDTYVAKPAGEVSPLAPAVSTAAKGAPLPEAGAFNVIPYTKDLSITNLEALPKGVGARYLVAIEGENGALVAKQWTRAPKSFKPGEMLVDMDAGKLPPTDHLKVGDKGVY
uniref:Uncharacterized protein n=1 Tax=viral metagenome TaxID=1070528 RepID=A0A6M3KZ65_9ZZZZ